MVILVFSAYYLPGYKGGGPIKTVANLVTTTSASFEYHIVTKDRDLGDSGSYSGIISNKWVNKGEASVFYSRPGFMGLTRGWSQVLRGGYDIVYLNSFFSPFFSFVPLLLAKLSGKRVVLGPRGEFSRGALSLKAKKKARFIFFYKLLGLHRGVVFQASSKFELEDVKHVLGSGVDIVVAEDIGRLETPESIPFKSLSHLNMVFLSRISPKKNLLYAIEMLKGVRCCVNLDVYGPIEDQEYWAACLAVIEELPDNVVVKYCGELHPSGVVKSLSQYDLFYMPTKGENYGHVIAEAICSALPVLISDQTPWRNLEDQGIGWDIPLSEPQRYVHAIESAHAMTVDGYSQFRDHVLSWAKEKFENPEAIEANKAMFEYALRK